MQMLKICILGFPGNSLAAVFLLFAAAQDPVVKAGAELSRADSAVLQLEDCVTWGRGCSFELNQGRVRMFDGKHAIP